MKSFACARNTVRRCKSSRCCSVSRSGGHNSKCCSTVSEFWDPVVPRRSFPRPANSSATSYSWLSWGMGLTALFDVLDGTVARRSGRSTAFGAFYDSTLDRVADGFVLGGFAVFFATRPGGWSLAMVVVSVLGLIGSYLTSYTRARADALGVDASGGVLQRPERVVLLSAPQAFFGLALDGFVLSAILVLLTVTAWLTAAQRIRAVYVAMDRRAASDARGE